MRIATTDEITAWQDFFLPGLERFERLERLEPAASSIGLSNCVVCAIYRREEDSYALRTLLSTIHSGPRRVCQVATRRCRRGLRRRRARSDFRPTRDHEISRRPVFTTSAVRAAISESR